MGVLIRERGLVVAVARTMLVNCPRGAKCPPRGQVIIGGAYCASACPLILAGGVERLVGPVPMVGVHQITTVMKEVEGAAHLTTVKKIYEQASADRAIERYWTAMGIGDPVMALLRKTPAGDIRWLSLAEIRESRLATLALDFNRPIETTGANGLNGHAFDGHVAKPDLLTARGHAAGIEATLAYRRGGGVVEAAFRSAAPAGPQGNKVWTLQNGGDPLALSANGRAEAAADIPLTRFCALAKGWQDRRLLRRLDDNSHSGFRPRLNGGIGKNHH